MEERADEEDTANERQLGHNESATSSDSEDSTNLEEDIGVNVQDRIQPYLEIGKQLHVSSREQLFLLVPNI
jgi:hypothetical protein